MIPSEVVISVAVIFGYQAIRLALKRKNKPIRDQGLGFGYTKGRFKAP